MSNTLLHSQRGHARKDSLQSGIDNIALDERGRVDIRARRALDLIAPSQPILRAAGPIPKTRNSTRARLIRSTEVAIETLEAGRALPSALTASRRRRAVVEGCTIRVVCYRIRTHQGRVSAHETMSKLPRNIINECRETDAMPGGPSQAPSIKVP